MMLKLLLLLPLATWLLVGCGATVLVPTAVEQPRVVYFLQHARHSSLLLTAADSRRIRYAYGDWAWYVEEQEGVHSGARALLWPSQGALGRALLPPAREGESLARVIGVGIDRAHCMRLEADRVDRLLAELDADYRAGGATLRSIASRGLHFVPHPRPYTLLHNSNQVTARWLRALGAEVRGSPALGYWEFIDPAMGKVTGADCPPEVSG